VNDPLLGSGITSLAPNTASRHATLNKKKMIFSGSSTPPRAARNSNFFFCRVGRDGARVSFFSSHTSTQLLDRIQATNSYQLVFLSLSKTRSDGGFLKALLAFLRVHIPSAPRGRDRGGTAHPGALLLPPVVRRSH